jgi:hypothetical protein
LVVYICIIFFLAPKIAYTFSSCSFATGCFLTVGTTIIVMGSEGISVLVHSFELSFKLKGQFASAPSPVLTSVKELIYVNNRRKCYLITILVSNVLLPNEIEKPSIL